MTILLAIACTSATINSGDTADAVFDSGDPIADTDVGDTAETGDSAETGDWSTAECGKLDDCPDCFHPTTFSVRSEFFYSHNSFQAESYIIDGEEYPPSMELVLSDEVGVTCEVKVYQQNPALFDRMQDSWVNAYQDSVYWGFTFPVVDTTAVESDCDLSTTLWGTELIATLMDGPTMGIGLGVLNSDMRNALAAYGMDTDVLVGGGFEFDGAYYAGYARAIAVDGITAVTDHDGNHVYIAADEITDAAEYDGQNIPSGIFSINFESSADPVNTWASVCPWLN